MQRNLLSDVDRLGRELADLHVQLIRQAGAAADDAANYIAPRARKFAAQFQREGLNLGRAAGRNPSAATGALIGALVLGTVVGFFLAGASKEERE